MQTQANTLCMRHEAFFSCFAASYQHRVDKYCNRSTYSFPYFASTYSVSVFECAVCVCAAVVVRDDLIDLVHVNRVMWLWPKIHSLTCGHYTMCINDGKRPSVEKRSTASTSTSNNNQPAIAMRRIKIDARTRKSILTLHRIKIWKEKKKYHIEPEPEPDGMKSPVHRISSFNRWMGRWCISTLRGVDLEF